MTYHITLSDGTAVDVKADSASEAIWKGLDRYRERTVTACYSGNASLDPGINRDAGRIRYEIPNHQPLPPKPKEPCDASPGNKSRPANP